MICFRDEHKTNSGFIVTINPTKERTHEHTELMPTAATLITMKIAAEHRIDCADFALVNMVQSGGRLKDNSKRTSEQDMAFERELKGYFNW